MPNWQLTASDPLALRLAADVRQFQTDYTDDHIWELILGEGEAPALSLETRYGGRCGLARLIPMWVVDGTVIYEAAACAAPPVLHTFWPGYFRLTLRPVEQLVIQVEYWAISSHVVGGRFTFLNEGDALLEVGADMIAQVMREEEFGDISALTLEGDQFALHLEDVGDLQPVLMMHAVRASAEARPKLSARMHVPPGEKTSIRWVLASRPSMPASLALAHHWLTVKSWREYLQQLGDLNRATPQIETGDKDRDAAIAFSYKVALNSFVGPTQEMPYPSFVFTRMPGRGLSQNGTGSDHYWQWSGQSALEAFALLSAMASAAPELAQGVIHNYLAVSDKNGFIDARPGLAGQQRGFLSMPLLATTAWTVYQYSGDKTFIAEVFDGLVRFFDRWFLPDMDSDGDGLPEWGYTAQSGYDNHPIFNFYRRWSQNADVIWARSPALAALLIREARSLLAMAKLLKKSGQLQDKATAEHIQRRLTVLLDQLALLWNDETGSYHYQDRVTGAMTAGGLLVEGGGDETLIPSIELESAQRLVVRVQGGRDHRPEYTITLEGLDQNGEAITESLTWTKFDWYRSRGAVTTDQLFTRLDRVATEGLSRVYTVQVNRIDWTWQDQTLLLPLWAGLDDPARVERLVQTATDPDRYWRAYGMPVCAANSPAYDADNRNGSGGVWLPWNVMMGDGLINAGRSDLAADLLNRILTAQVHTLKTEKGFREAYNADALAGIGDRDYVWGIVPLHLLWRLMGFRIISDREVAIGGTYVLPWPVRVQQHGVLVERNQKGARITFPSGEVKRVRSAKWRVIADETVPAAEPVRRDLHLPPPPPGPTTTHKKKTVQVKVQQ